MDTISEQNMFSVESVRKEYDLEERTFIFAKNIRCFIKKVKQTISNIEDIKQLIRSSGSIGANYIEANDSLGKKDFLMHIRISKKEAKESRYWLRLLDIENNSSLQNDRNDLVNESTELMNIMVAIIIKFR